MNIRPSGSGGAGGASQHAHLDPEALADFRADLISGRQGRAIAAHLAGCADCAALDDRLAQVSARLATVPVPVMPDAVVRRLDTVIAAKAAERTLVQSPGPRRAPSRPGTDLVRIFRPRILGQVAAALVLLAGVGFGLSQLTGGSSSSSSAAGSAARGTQGPISGRGGVAPGSGSLGPRWRAGTASANVASGEVFVVHSNVDYQPSTLGQQLSAELAARPAMSTWPTGPSATGPSAMGPSATGPSATVASGEVRACVLHVANGAPIVLVESARYRGAPALIVIVSGSGGEQAWVAGPKCSGTDSDILTSVSLS